MLMQLVNIVDILAQELPSQLVCDVNFENPPTLNHTSQQLSSAAGWMAVANPRAG